MINTCDECGCDLLQCECEGRAPRSPARSKTPRRPSKDSIRAQVARNVADLVRSAEPDVCLDPTSESEADLQLRREVLNELVSFLRSGGLALKAARRAATALRRQAG